MVHRMLWGIAAVMMVAGLWSAPARAQSGTIFGFGDSLIDIRRACLPFGYPGSLGGCSNGRNDVQFLPSLTGYSLNPANIYAVGGAGTGATFPGTVLPISTADQVAELTQSGQRIGARDLVLLSGFGNDSFAFLNPAFPLSGAQFGQVALQEQSQNVARLIAAGARNIVAYNFAVPQLQVLAKGGLYSGGAWAPLPVAPAAVPFADTVQSGLARMLAGYAGPGTQIRVLDFSTIVSRALLTPSIYAAYGVQSSQPCLMDPACVTAPRSVQNQHFFYDVHPTETGHLILATYIANLLGAQDAIPLQSDIVRGAATGFTGGLLDRLEAGRSWAAPFDSRAELPRKAPASGPAVAPASGLAVYIQGNDWGGGRDGQLSATGLVAGGGSFEAAGGTVGVERRFSPSLLAGAAFNVATTHVATGPGSKTDVDSYQLAGYASFGGTAWFTDIVAGYGRHRFAIDRQGVIDVLHASTSADTFAAAVRAGYLFDVGELRAGPIAGLAYAHAAIGGYTESGDSVITQHVNRQSSDSLIGSIGLQLRRSFALGTAQINPYLNVTAEHEFLDRDRWIVTQQTSAIELPIWTPVGGAAARTYGRVLGGIGTALGGGLSTTLTAFTTFARSGGELHGVSGGLKYQF